MINEYHTTQVISEEPLVSVIMNCYNGEKYLREAVDSVIAQTYQNWELIFWDNQSTDSSAEIVKSYDDHRIRYFYADRHTTLGEARNLAVDCAQGEWLAFLDCDDVYYTNKLKEQVSAVDCNIGMIYCRCELLVEDEDSIFGRRVRSSIFPAYKTLKSGQILSDLLLDCFIRLPSVLISKSVFDDVGGIDSKLTVTEDYDIFLKIASLHTVISVDVVLCKYRIHANNLSNSKVINTFEESIQLVKTYSKYQNIFYPLVKWRLQYLLNIVRCRQLKLFLIKFYLICLNKI